MCTPTPGLEIPLDPPSGTPTTPPDAAASERPVQINILLGGCGDLRHFFATLLDASVRCKQPGQLRLRAVLNDITPETMARGYMVLTDLCGIADHLKGGAVPKTLSDEIKSAAVFCWHIYQGAALDSDIYEQLKAHLERAAAADKPPLDFVRMGTAGWETLRNVMRGWLSLDMSVSQERRQMREMCGEAVRSHCSANHNCTTQFAFARVMCPAAPGICAHGHCAMRGTARCDAGPAVAGRECVG